MREIRVLLAIACGLALACVVPPAASAAPYILYSCKAPNGSPAPTDGWSGSPSTRGAGVLYEDLCASGGPLRGVVDESTEHERGTSIGFSFAAPPDVRITGYDLSRRVALDPAVRRQDGSVQAAFDYSLFRGEFLNFAPPARREECASSGNPPCPGLDGVFSESGADVDDLFFFADCNVTFEDCPAGLGGSIELRAARLTLEDGLDPSFRDKPEGSLLDTSGPQSGVRSVAFTAADRGGGVGRVALEIDGRPVADRRYDDVPGECREPYVRRVPCPPSVSDSFSVDTAALADGRHEVRLVVTDATRVNSKVFGPVTIETANRSAPARPGPGGGPGPAAPSCLDSPSLRVTGKPQPSTVAFGARGVFAGDVRDAAGAPVQGAAVRVLNGSRTIGSTTTGRTGRYRLRLPPGPNRSLTAVVGVPGGLACSTASLLKVRAGVTLGISRRRVGLGRSVGFSGRLKAGPIPRRGRLVVLQVRDRRGWQVLKVVRTDARGRYRYAYRFRRSRGTFTYRFRAQVRRERGYPYALGYSPTRRLTVIGR